MIHIYLNNTEVYPEKDTSIKITRENPVLTGSGSYTLDVNIPLSYSDNKKFFGALDRIETLKEYKTYSAELRDDNRTLLIGTAVLTKVTESAASVQILAGNSNVRFWNNADTQFIDQYDLNTDGGVDIVTDWLNRWGFVRLDATAYDDWAGVQWMKQGLTYAQAAAFWGVEGKFTAAPFIDSGKEDVEGASPTYRWGNFTKKNARNNSYQFMFKTPHPNLLYVVRKLCELRGYAVDLSYLQNTWAKDIYIASAIPTTSIAMTLPHWSVKEFFDQFCKLFNVTMMFDDVKMTMSFVDNRSFFSRLIEVSDIEDIFDNEIEDSGDANIMFSNIGYAESNNKMQNVGKSIRGKYQTISANGYNDALMMMRAGADYWAFYGHEGDIYVAGKDGNGVVWPNTCDIFRPMDRKSSTDVELKIVPAKTDYMVFETTFLNVPYESDYIGTDEYIWVENPDGGMYDHEIRVQLFRKTISFEDYSRSLIRALDLQNGYGGYRRASGSLLQELNGEDTTAAHGEKESYMPIFMISGSHVKVYAQKQEWQKIVRRWYKNNEGIWVLHDTIEDNRGENWGAYDIGMAIRIPFTDRWLDGWQHPDGNNSGGCEASLSIAGSRHGNEIASFHRNCPRFNERSQLHVRFLSRNIPDVFCCFVIRGKRYACKKIEYVLDNDGISPMLEGYFVEIL